MNDKDKNKGQMRHTISSIKRSVAAKNKKIMVNSFPDPDSMIIGSTIGKRKN